MSLYFISTYTHWYVTIFKMKGLMRIELAAMHASAMNEQFRAEINQRLDFIEEHLKLRISKAKADPSYADSLVGVARMSGTTMRSSIERASRVRSLYI
jgi:hypothetical protein